MFEEDPDLVGLLKTITSEKILTDNLLSYSPFERFPYYEDKLPTITYLKTIENSPFSIEANYNSKKNLESTGVFDKLKDNLKNYTYTSDTYRLNIYPFNSTTYLNYLNKEEFDLNELNLKQLFEVDTKEGLLKTPTATTYWAKPQKASNLFTEKLKIGTKSSANILNTPYFHKQLESDFGKQSYGKYAGSAYLLLNSLSFIDLEDNFEHPNGKTRLSTVFKEVSASHYVPYHLIIKWGSIYHRYKKKILDNVDILSPFFTGTTTPISGRTFFDGGNNLTYNVGENINYNSNIVGVHPLYDSMYHQVQVFVHFWLNHCLQILQSCCHLVVLELHKEWCCLLW
jgi:hypothetical protein